MKAYYVTETNDLCRLTIISNESLLKKKKTTKIYTLWHIWEKVLIPNVKIQYELVTNIQLSSTFYISWPSNSHHLEIKLLPSQRDQIKEGQRNQWITAKTDHEITQPSQKHIRGKTQRNTASECVAITCSDKRFCSFWEGFFFFLLSPPPPQKK